MRGALPGHGLPDAVYRDPGPRSAARPARIGSELAAFAQAQPARIGWRRRDAGEFLGRFLSAPKAELERLIPEWHRAGFLLLEAGP